MTALTMDKLHLQYNGAPQTGDVVLPGSKSMAARALIINALAGGDAADMAELPDCDDTRRLSAALAALRAAAGPLPERFVSDAPAPVSLCADLGEGGTSLRFFTALVASLPGVTAKIDCAPQLRRRPLAPLTDALVSAGADIVFDGEEGRAPLTVRGRRLEGGALQVDSSESSQFASALMMAAPYWHRGTELSFGELPPVSFPYILMTEKMMHHAGAAVTAGDGTVYVRRGAYLPGICAGIEPDWSAAGYFYELAMMMPGRDIRLARLTPAERSAQGDSGAAMIFGLLGVRTLWGADGSATLRCNPEILGAMRRRLSPVVFDMGRMPDLVPALAVALCFCGVRFELRGIAHLRVKECDRLSALSAELSRFGFRIEAGGSTMSWTGERTAPETAAPVVSTYGDHRIAMAFAAAAPALPGGVTIAAPAVVSKSFPAFYEQLACLGIR